ncbi:MAG: PqqD family protein [Lachnospiraceae bacterium]|nr:PqqD family protein [Lachnospiraceae bacterium]MCH4064581.1 PqqD family protein [Lachnospiraceae bacterium]MCH4104812.1 PqqD family protein [Lachnospiraceae bacterium]MCI1308545.1 PqqD family protein [Lachnospiraceae bacterium]MCI1357508.1 PqqD family protein [Lachnospiraceae bacterium]
MKETAADMQPTKGSGSSEGSTPAEGSDATRDAYIQAFGNKKYQIDPDFVLRKIAGTSVIVPTGSDIDPSLENSVMTPNRTAEVLWEIFESPCTAQQAVQKCLDLFDGPRAQIENDVCRFISDSIQKKVLREVQ